MQVSSQMPLADGLISRNPSVTPPVALYMTVLLYFMLAKHNSGKKKVFVPLFQGDATVTYKWFVSRSELGLRACDLLSYSGHGSQAHTFHLYS